MIVDYTKVEYCEQIEPPVRMIEPASAINRATQCERESHWCFIMDRVTSVERADDLSDTSLSISVSTSTNSDENYSNRRKVGMRVSEIR